LLRLVRWRSRSRWRERLWELSHLILGRWRERFRELSHVLLIETCEETSHAIPPHHLNVVVHVGFQARKGAAVPGFINGLNLRNDTDRQAYRSGNILEEPKTFDARW
jgi:hypothetical protein